MFLVSFLSILFGTTTFFYIRSNKLNRRNKHSPNWNSTRKRFQHYWKQDIKIFNWKTAWEFIKAPSPQWPTSVQVLHTANPFNTPHHITNIGHATFLIQFNQCNILTDPVFSDRAGPLGIFGPKRISPPGIALDALPPIDIIFISHNHYDHLDARSIKRLAQTHSATIIVPLGLKDKVQKLCPNLTVVELDWWETHVTKGISITATPAQHWSRRGLFDMNKTLWIGGIFQSDHYSVFFAGDTGLGPHFADIAAKHSRIDVGLLPIGAYLPHRVMHVQHMGPKDALKAHQILGTKRMIPVHYDVFKLGKEGYQDAEKELINTAKVLSIPADSINILRVGQTLSLKDL